MLRVRPAVFYALSKTLDLAFSPLSWALVLLLVAFLCRRRSRCAWTLVLVAAGVLDAFSTPRIAGAIERATEAGARSTYRPEVVYDAAIVPGGIIDWDANRRSGELELMEEGDRLVRAFELWRTGHARSIVLTGGSDPGSPPEAEQLRDALVRWGVPPDAILVEARSRNTRQNAVETARILPPDPSRRVLLVTSAWHAPRALGCFRRVGFEPDLLPVDHRGEEDGGWQPRARALAQSSIALRELAGRAVYWAMGYTR